MLASSTESTLEKLADLFALATLLSSLQAGNKEPGSPILLDSCMWILIRYQSRLLFLLDANAATKQQHRTHLFKKPLDSALRVLNRKI